MGLLELIPEITTSDGLPIIYVPLSFIVLATALKDFLEDWKRHRSDNEENQQRVLKAAPEAKAPATPPFVEEVSENLRVGDIVKINQNEVIPADILLLRSTNPKGATYVETKNLDGETNLKLKFVHNQLLPVYATDASTLQTKCTVKFEAPNPSIYKFQGTLEFAGEPRATKHPSVSLQIDNILLRGCQLKNTKYIIGMVVYTGHETKILQNSSFPSMKKAKLQIQMNKFILIIVAIQVLICLFSAIYNSVWQLQTANHFFYLEIHASDYETHFWSNMFIKFFAWQMLLMNFIPISLLITLDITRILQSFIIQEDKHLHNQKFKVSVQTSTIIEDVGQVQCIFSDKTGTLTNNQMNFVSLWIAGTRYGQPASLPSSKPQGALKENPGREGLDAGSAQPTLDRLGQEDERPLIPSVNFRDANYFRVLGDASSEAGRRIIDALMCLCTCHSILLDQETQEYQSSSPDEISFINFAKWSGYSYIATDENNVISIRAPDDSVIQLSLLQKLEFTSERKRMSVIVRDQSGQTTLFVKGADNVLVPRLRDAGAADHAQIEQLQLDLQQYGSQGLRTLVLASRALDATEFVAWNERYEAAKARINSRDEEMERVMEELERDLSLVGATAIEDELQEEVTETIQAFKSVGIQLWVLTGDKKETAIAVGYSIGIINSSSIIMDINQRVLEQIDAESLKKSKGHNSLLVPGDFIEIMSLQPPVRQRFIALFPLVQTVIAYRVSPKQKRELVHLYKSVYPEIRTLAIGDGANDVNMITEAHVGIGIKGVEGMQAARSSDFAIGQFKHLRRLLLTHGREAYRKNADLINYNFYKNFVYLLPLFWYNISCGFSGITIYDIYLFQLYNLVFCDLPIFFYAVLDKEKPYKLLYKNPANYKPGIKNQHFNYPKLVYWLVQGCIHTFIIAFCVILSINICASNGKQSYMELDG